MILKSVHIRFYKSFNHDFVRKLNQMEPTEKITPEPWEFVNDTFFPHVKVGLDSQITTVVGANESGKSHLLSAIEKARYGDQDKFKIAREDFCRYSQFFDSVEENVPRYPEIGLQFGNLSSNEIKQLKGVVEKHPEKDQLNNVDYKNFYFFRYHDSIALYLPLKQSKVPKKSRGNNKAKSEQNEKTVEEIETSNLNLRKQSELRYLIIKNPEEFPPNFLPPVFRIKSDIPLPSEILIDDLLTGRMDENIDEQRRKDESNKHTKSKNLLKIFRNQNRLISILNKLSENNISTPVTFTESEIEEFNELSEELKSEDGLFDKDKLLEAIRGFNLAHDLLFKICRINKEDINQIRLGFEKKNTGMVRANLNKIDKALAKKLRFQNIWSQDKDFAINVTATEIYLQFSITDRTGCPYSFDERSGGLKHFLSYYAQYLTHDSPAETNSEILLMDEPDAYLSGDAQQDLLKILQFFADPHTPGADSARKPVQVIYVTHSPFLIDKNHSERVRAVDKLEGSYGTRVIPGLTQNRYEPLRSAFGAFLGETVFMSQCNLMVEGRADQILLAGAVGYLRSIDKKIPESEILDLNKITIVPCDGADNVAFMSYLATGKGTEKPAVIAMLDSDKQGLEARQKFTKKGDQPDSKAVLPDKYILSLGDITRKEIYAEIEQDKANEKPFIDLEDLIPLSLSLRTVKYFLKDFFKLNDDSFSDLIPERVKEKHKELNIDPKKPISIFASIQNLVEKINNERFVSISKVVFAKTIIELLPEWTKLADKDDDLKKELGEFTANIRAVLRKLKSMQKMAEQTARENAQRKNVEQKINLFFSDYQDQANIKRDAVSTFLAELIQVLEGSQDEIDFITKVINEIRSGHKLNEDPSENIGNRELLFNQLHRINGAKQIIEEQRKNSQ